MRNSTAAKGARAVAYSISMQNLSKAIKPFVAIACCAGEGKQQQKKRPFAVHFIATATNPIRVSCCLLNAIKHPKQKSE